MPLGNARLRVLAAWPLCHPPTNFTGNFMVTINERLRTLCRQRGTGLIGRAEKGNRCCSKDRPVCQSKGYRTNGVGLSGHLSAPCRTPQHTDMLPQHFRKSLTYRTREVDTVSSIPFRLADGAVLGTAAVPLF